MPRKKKEQKESKLFKTTSEQVLKDDTITISEVKKFIEDCRKGKRQDFLDIADRSWDEIEKRNKKGKLYGGNDLYRLRRWTRYPVWWSCWKIRQPIVFARLPVPILKDTQGDDPIGRTACVIGERFIKSMLKTFDAFTEFASGIDDFLVTNFGWGRWFYKTEMCIEDEKIRLQVITPEPPQMEMAEQPEESPEMESQEPQQPIFIDPNGNQVTDNILEDDLGPYILTGQKVEVDLEQVFFESQLYSALYVEPDVRKWNEVTRCAYEYHYSYGEFKEKFGADAIDKLAIGDIEDHKTGKPVVVFEYWDKTLKEVRWLAENSDDFFQPQYDYATDARVDTSQLQEVEEQQTDYDNSDLYGLSGFFPSTYPLIFNNTTKSFWPTPEFFQVADLLDDIHSIVGRMILLTKAIRVRFFYDSSIPQLSSLIGETGEGGGLGIPNLEQNLIQGKGTLSTLVQYFPVAEMVDGLNNMYTAFQNRMDMFYQITGISDLIRGQTNPDSDKTYGERQLEGKFALNRIEPYQRRSQEWLKDNYQLGMEFGLKMFSDATVDEYIVPQTLDEEDKARYVPALSLLKENKRRRFRIDFETDSTIAINENWRRNQAIQTADVITKMMEATANVAQTNPQMAQTELKIMEHVIGELTNGKLFVDEVKKSIQETIDTALQPKNEPNLEMEKLKLEGAKFQFEQQKQAKADELEVLKIQAEERIEVAKLQQNERFAAIDAQLTQFKTQADNQLKLMQLNEDTKKSQSELQLQYEKISADIAQASQDFELKKQDFLLEVRKVTDKKEVDQFALMLEARTKIFEERLLTAQQQLDATYKDLDEKEKYWTEMRLQSEHQLNQRIGQVEVLGKMADMLASIEDAKKIREETRQLSAPEPVKEELKPNKPKIKKTKIKRTRSGDIDELITTVHEAE